MSNSQDLLIEIGTEELPPKSLKRLATAFMENISQSLNDNDLTFDEVNWYATPRRLAVIVNQLQVSQQDKEQQRRGPAIDAAYDEKGNPTKATEGFARSCGVGIEELEQLDTDKGSWLIFNTVITGKQTTELLPEIINHALKRLPVAKRMRWGNNEIEFVRPIKWVLIMFETEIIDTNIMGINSGEQSYGHRFHHSGKITIKNPDNYLKTLVNKGKVIADFNERKNLIVEQVNKLANSVKSEVIIDSDLLDEVTALVEWPVSFIGEFDPEFLKLPEEVLIATMQDHQKYFPVVDKQKKLLPHFICVSNIESKQVELVKTGNERVIQPRLKDAAFFWEKDIKHGLANHIDSLKNVIYQQQLGSLHEKSQRISKIISKLADSIDIEIKHGKRAADLCLCDLLTEMVYEFPELQGTMGRYYADQAGEDKSVAVAIEEFYQPRFAGDALPETTLGQCLAIAEKIDSLVGIFAIGKAPTGDKDPFGLRRSAIGLLRIIIECELDIDLKQLIQQAASNFPDTIKSKDNIDNVYEFLMERLRRYYLDKNVDADTFEAVLAIKTTQPLDFHQRIHAVTEFRKLAEAESLAAANKRINNILKKSDTEVSDKIDKKLLSEDSEIKLANSLTEFQKRLTPIIDKRDYKSALTELAGLRDDVDMFFDNVMVMCDDTEIKNNRLALLNNLSALFLETADISKLQG